jgi:hypothetical protein
MVFDGTKLTQSMHVIYEIHKYTNEKRKRKVCGVMWWIRGTDANNTAAR